MYYNREDFHTYMAKELPADFVRVSLGIFV